MVQGPANLKPDMIVEAYDRVRRNYGAAIGRHRSELVTPTLVLDLPVAKRNIAQMAQRISLLSAEIRPHIKVHKNPELARLQVEAGAIGLSVATIWEAAVFVLSGFNHVFVVNTVAGSRKVGILAQLAREADLMVGIDNAGNAEQLAEAARAAGSELGVLIEVDTGMDRCGVDNPGQALELARHVAGLKGLQLRGISGYEGHCSMILDRETRHEKEQSAMASFVEVAELLEREGIPCPIRSAGGTATWNWTAGFPGVTEIQAGTYAVMDNDHASMIEGFDFALTVQTTVISRPTGRIIVDAGGKSIGDGELTRIGMVGYPYEPVRFDEEHGIFDAPDVSALRVGDSVALIPGYAPSTVNMYDAYHVIEGDVVVDIWPVIPRGPGHHGLYSGG